MNTTTPARAASYLRKSTDEQEQSIGRQRDQVTRYARDRGYRLTAEYKDEGIAGDVFDRRAWHGSLRSFSSPLPR